MLIIGSCYIVRYPKNFNVVLKKIQTEQIYDISSCTLGTVSIFCKFCNCAIFLVLILRFLKLFYLFGIAYLPCKKKKNTYHQLNLRILF